MKRLQEQATQKDKERRTKKESMETLNGELSRFRQNLLKKNSLSGRLELLNAEILKRKENYQSLTERLEKVKGVHFDEERYQGVASELEKVSKIYDSILRAEDVIKEIEPLQERIQKTKSDIKMCNVRILELDEEIKKLHFDEEAFEQINGEIDRTQSALQGKKDEKAVLLTNTKVLESEIKSIDEKLEENKKILSSLKKKEDEMNLLLKLDEVYKSYKTDKLTKLAPALSSIMSAYIESITDGKYDQIELDEKYNISIYRNGIKNSLDFYSGGEKKLAALCQRLAISELLVGQTGQANFDMLAMDEVFGAMDNERQDSIVDMLRNLNETFPQILIVAHNEHVKELFDFVLEVKQDKDGFSTLSWTADWDQDEVIDISEEFDELEQEETTEDEAS